MSDWLFNPVGMLLDVISAAYKTIGLQGGLTDPLNPGNAPPPLPITPIPYDQKTDDQKVQNARSILLAEGLIFGGAALAPAIYAYTKRKKKILKPGEIRLGQSLENASNALSGPVMTALAAPAISTAFAYITVQMLEDAGIIKKGLGDATQGLLTVAAAGPMIQGIGQIASSAFKMGK